MNGDMGQTVNLPTEIRPLKEVEREHIELVLTYFNGDKPKAASALGISLKTLYNRLERWGINYAPNVGFVTR